MLIQKISVIVLLSIVMIQCKPKSTGSEEQENTETEQLQNELVSLANPSQQGSGEPYLSNDGKTIKLRWIESNDQVATLRYSSFQDGQFTEAHNITSGDDWFVNWADFPSLFHKNEKMHINYLQSSGEGVFAYDIKVLTKNTNQDTWSEPVKLHSDTVKGEHGFVSFFDADSLTGVVWLDGRNSAGGHGGHGGHGEGAMNLRAAWIDSNGNVSGETLLDDRICDCCQTSSVGLSNGEALTVYRDRKPEELRDISMIRYSDGKWSEPVFISDQNWEIAGCPVNGPSISAHESLVAIGWFTGAEGKPTVKLKISNDFGYQFTESIIIDDQQPTGRVNVQVLPNKKIALIWVGKTAEGHSVNFRLYSAEGEMLTEKIVTDINPGRGTGFPKMTYLNGTYLFAWTDIETSTIKTVSMQMP